MGTSIQPGTVLAVIQWEDSLTEAAFAQEPCTGTIQWINQDIDTVYLSLPTSSLQSRFTFD